MDVKFSSSKRVAFRDGALPAPPTLHARRTLIKPTTFDKRSEIFYITIPGLIPSTIRPHALFSFDRKITTEREASAKGRTHSLIQAHRQDTRFLRGKILNWAPFEGWAEPYVLP